MQEIYCVLRTGQNNSIRRWRNSICQRQDFRLDESPSTERKGSHEDMVTCGLDATKFMGFTERYSHYRTDVPQNISYLSCVSIVGISLVRMKITCIDGKLTSCNQNLFLGTPTHEQNFMTSSLKISAIWYSFSLSYIKSVFYTGNNRCARARRSDLNASHAKKCKFGSYEP